MHAWIEVASSRACILSRTNDLLPLAAREIIATSDDNERHGQRKKKTLSDQLQIVSTGRLHVEEERSGSTLRLFVCVAKASIVKSAEQATTF